MKRAYLWSMYLSFVLQIAYILLKICGICNYSWVIMFGPSFAAAGITMFVVLMYIVLHLYK